MWIVNFLTFFLLFLEWYCLIKSNKKETKIRHMKFLVLTQQILTFPSVIETAPLLLFIYLTFLKIEIQLAYNIVLVLGVQHDDLRYIYIYIYNINFPLMTLLSIYHLSSITYLSQLSVCPTGWTLTDSITFHKTSVSPAFLLHFCSLSSTNVPYTVALSPFTMPASFQTCYISMPVLTVYPSSKYSLHSCCMPGSIWDHNEELDSPVPAFIELGPLILRLHSREGVDQIFKHWRRKAV